MSRYWKAALPFLLAAVIILAAAQPSGGAAHRLPV